MLNTRLMNLTYFFLKKILNCEIGRVAAIATDGQGVSGPIRVLAFSVHRKILEIRKNWFLVKYTISIS